MSEYGKTAKGFVFSAHVKVTDIESRAREMVAIISNTSWIDKLNVVEKITFQARANRTIDHLVNIIKSRVENELTAEFGEFLVSETAQSALDTIGHIKMPLAELLKEKVAGNPGFDFHTESYTKLISFGEAKFSTTKNPYANAMNQIVAFIELRKDEGELIIIQNFVSAEAIDNSSVGNKAYAAAFSINGVKPEQIIKNALLSKAIDPLLKFPEIYVIGIEIDA